VTELRNRYFNCLTADRHPEPWSLATTGAGELLDSVYFGAVLAEMDRRVARDGRTVYLTQDLEELPTYGDDVVALVVGDELARVPSYADRVGAIFKNQAVRPLMTADALRDPSWVNFWWWIAYLRMWRHHAPGAARWLRRRHAPGALPLPAPVCLLPIGILNQPEMPVIAMAERQRDLFFAGSVSHRAAGMRDRVAPKVLARKAMIASAEQLERAHPELVVTLATTGSFGESLAGDPDSYSRQLMDAKIALVPRGAAADTFRFWQALRYGCIVVTDVLPRHRWFYDDAPVVRLGRWTELEEAVVPLLADERRLTALHRRSLAWWSTRGAPAAVGAYVAARLDAIDDFARR